MKKIISVPPSSTEIEKLKEALKEKMGSAYVWEAPSKNIFISDDDDFVEVCCYTKGGYSICGFGYLKDHFDKVTDVIAAIKGAGSNA